MMRAFAGFASGLVFGAGLVLSGMTRPSKVQAFLDFTGAWDPSLALVMLGAIATFAPLYRYLTDRVHPVFAPRFVVYRAQLIDPRLIVGSLLFGVGWGISGFCPGPSLVSAGSGALPAVVFGASMAFGMVLFRGYERVLEFFADRTREPIPIATVDG